MDAMHYDATFLLAFLRWFRIGLHILPHTTWFVYSASVRLILDVSVTWLKNASSAASYHQTCTWHA